MPKPPITIQDKYLSFQILALATFIVFALFIWQGSNGFDLSDEGYLWYGAKRVMLGEVPIRDFMSYDPGRYYWSAALMSLYGDNGILALRGAVAIFQMMGLFIGLLLIARVVKKQNFLYLLLSAVTLIVWMHPRHKLFDISLSILLIGVLTFLIQNPTSRRYFYVGVCVGLIAIFGRNHGIYGVAGSLGVMAWLNIKRTEGTNLIKGFALWAAGVAFGYMPVLFMILLAPDFAGAFWESIRFLFEIEATNLPRPIPWPWRVDFASVPIGVAIRQVFIGLFYIATVIFGVLSIVWVVWQKIQNKNVPPALVAATFMALPYAQYAYSRAGIVHLAQGIFPLLVGCLVLLATQHAKIKWPLAIMLCVASLWVMPVFHPGWQCQINKQCVSIEISRSNLQIDSQTASKIGILWNLALQYTSDNQSFIAVPFLPGAYALLDRKSPMWEIFPVWPRSQAFEQAEIKRIKTAMPGFAFVLDYPLDGRDELRFRNTHPLIHQYILDHFEELASLPNSAFHIYKAKSGGNEENH